MKKRWHAFYPGTVPTEIDIPAVDVYQLLARTEMDYPAQLAVIDGQRQWTYTELKKDVDTFATALHQLGFKQGERIALMFPNSVEYIIAYYAAMRLGGIVVQVNPLYQIDELEHLVENSLARWFVTNDVQKPKLHALSFKDHLTKIYTVSPGNSLEAGEHDFYELIKETKEIRLPDVTIHSKEDIAVLQYTGGTTGRSKGVMLTHFNLVANVHQSFIFSDGYFERPGERILSITPFFHSYGMTGAMNLPVFGAGTIICMKRFEAKEAIHLMKTYQPTFLPGVPTMYIALLNHPESSPEVLQSMKVCNSGSAPMPVELMREFEEKTGAAIVEGYGLSEAGPITHRNPVTGLRKPGSIGIPLPNTDSKVVDRDTGTEELPPGAVGELILTGPQVMKGYWNNETETSDTVRNGWLFTGDLATMDEDGYFYIVGRKKEMIIASGYNVYPNEVEEILYKNNKIAEVCVFGVPSTYRGETVKAVIVLRAGEEATAEEISEWASRHMAAYKVPKEISFRSELPKSTVGKVLRRKLVDEEMEKAKATKQNG